MEIQAGNALKNCRSQSYQYWSRNRNRGRAGQLDFTAVLRSYRPCIQVPNLPTARISEPAIPEQNTLHISKLTPLLFHSLRMLAPIPALLGTLIHLYHFIHPPLRSEFNRSTRADYFAAAAWVYLRCVRSRLGLNKVWQSILTGVQCLYFTTGLLTRWKAYYPLLPTLIRLLGLQAICWPATHYTHVFLQYDGHSRPLLCWTVIGTTTCVSCSVSPPFFLPHDFLFRSPARSKCGSLRTYGNGTTRTTRTTTLEARPPLLPGAKKATKNGADASGIGTRSSGNARSPQACAISLLPGQCSSRGSCTAIKLLLSCLNRTQG